MYILYCRKLFLRRVMGLLFLGAALVLAVMGWQWLNGSVAPTMKTNPIYQGNPERKQMSLTFTIDWGEEYLPAILSSMKQTGVRATFFPTGQWASRHQKLVQQIAAAGHEIGNHGYAHPHPDHLSREENRQDIERAEKALMDIIGKKPVVYSPPYGESEPQVVAAATDLGYKFIMWTINTGDYLPGTIPEDVIDTVVSKCQNGAIVLLHPTEATTKALPELIKQLQDRGYELVTVSDVL